jgi:hypothetical protein
MEVFGILITFTSIEKDMINMEDIMMMMELTFQEKDGMRLIFVMLMK